MKVFLNTSFSHSVDVSYDHCQILVDDVNSSYNDLVSRFDIIIDNFYPVMFKKPICYLGWNRCHRNDDDMDKSNGLPCDDS